jgi:hypothetical protein
MLNVIVIPIQGTVIDLGILTPVAVDELVAVADDVTE